MPARPCYPSRRMKTERSGGTRPHLSAGVVVVRQTPAGWRFLMLRAYRNWDFPKGLVEAGEDPLSAARREVTEETLIADLQFAWGEVYIETAPYSRNKVARYYLAADLHRGRDLAGAAGAGSPRAPRMPLARVRRSPRARLPPRRAGAEWAGAPHRRPFPHCDATALQIAAQKERRPEGRLSHLTRTFPYGISAAEIAPTAAVAP